MQKGHAVLFSKLGFISFFLILFFIAFVSYLTVVLGLPTQVPLFLFFPFLYLWGRLIGVSFQDFLSCALKNVSKGLEAIIILIIVGAMVGTWMAGGIIPTFMYYGLDLLTPSIFLSSTLLICSFTALITGTSWGAASTVGVALMGIGQAMSISPPVLAGAILSGVYFGDKLSPLSDSTILSSGLAKVDLNKHIGHMLKISLPAYFLTLIAFYFVDLNFELSEYSPETAMSYKKFLSEYYQITPLLLLPILLTIILLVLRIPSIITMYVGVFAGIVASLFFQDASIQNALSPIYFGPNLSIDSDSYASLSSLINRGGIKNMFDPLMIIILGLSLSGALESLGITAQIKNLISCQSSRSGKFYIFITPFLAFFMNIVGCAMYVSLVLSIKILEDHYQKSKLPSEDLSRGVEIGSTLTSAMVPWSDNGVFMTMILGVSTLEYIPYLWLTYITWFVYFLFFIFQRKKSIPAALSA